MTDIFSKEKRSEVMSLVRGRDTKPELALRRILSASLYPAGYRYRLHPKSVPGKPDVAFMSQRVAVFVDGAFWHGYDFANMGKKLPKKFWFPKIQRNMERDREINRKLLKAGWKVIRIWDHVLKKNPKRTLARIVSALEKN